MSSFVPETGFAQGASGLASVYDTSPTGLGMSPSYLAAGASATSLSASGSGSELDYVKITSTANVTATTSGTADTVITGSAVTYDGSTPVWIEFGAPNVVKGTTNITVGLWDGATFVCVMAFVSGAAQLNGAWRTRLTPTAGSHTYSIRAFVDAGTGNVTAGAGTGGANMPAYIRIAKA